MTVRLTAPPGATVPGSRGLVPARVPSPLGRDAARELARRELSKPIYHQGGPLADRVRAKIVTLFARLLAHADSAVPGGWWALVILAALAVLVLGVVLARAGPVSRAHRASAALLPGVAASARDYRARAEQSAAAGEWVSAIRHRLRAIARDLEERAILTPRDGRTADELAVEAGRALPPFTGALWSAVRLFDDVYYGERPATPEGYARLRELDEDIRAARPAPLDAAQTAQLQAPQLPFAQLRTAQFEAAQLPPARSGGPAAQAASGEGANSPAAGPRAQPPPGPTRGAP